MQTTKETEGETFNRFFPLSPELVRRLLSETGSREEWGDVRQQNAPQPS